MWLEIEEPIEKITLEVKDLEPDFDLDKWYAYWMDEVDPRGSKRLSLEEFQMVGGGDY